MFNFKEVCSFPEYPAPVSLCTKHGYLPLLAAVNGRTVHKYPHTHQGALIVSLLQVIAVSVSMIDCIPRDVMFPKLKKRLNG